MVMAHRKLASTSVFLCLLLLVNSCASFGAKQTPEVYYTIPPVTYLREFPGYASRIVVTLYHGEQVSMVSSREDGWCQVHVSQSRQVGWMPRPLLSEVPINLETYYVQANEVPLRDTPQEEVISRYVLYRGDKVSKLSENQQGWWRVLVEKDKRLGWVPAAVVSIKEPERAAPGKGITGPTEASLRPATQNSFYVATTTLKLQLLPLASSQVVKVLQFNDAVEKVSQSGPTWLKVRYPETGAQGWVLARYLSESPAKSPKTFTRKKKTTPRRPKQQQLQEEQSIPSEDLDPEVM
jgi:uncharacterized protein YgiM (DUF1202 family)